MSRAWVVLVAALAACLEPALVACPDDLLCPAGHVCDPAHRTCLLPEQLETCRGLIDDTTCLVAGTVGYCRDEICFPITCGNGILDATEVCDDGNVLRGDGCNTTCTSNETCGNGIVDSGAGEDCDDANHVDGDRCDSRCRTETEMWTVTGLDLSGDAPGQMAYDEARHQMVFVTEGTTWRYDGTRWSLVTVEGLPTGSWTLQQVTYDADRGRVVLIGRHLGPLFAYEWDGSAWSAIPLQAPPPLTAARMVHDPVHHAILLVGVQQGTGLKSWLLDTTTGVLAPQADVTALAGELSMAWDAARNVAVIASSNNVFEWDGTTWTRTIVTAQPTYAGFSLVFDRQENAIIAVGGTDGGIGPTTTVMKWPGGGTQWIDLPAQALPIARRGAAVAWDRDRGVRVVFGGVGPTSFAQQADTFEWNGLGWTRALVPMPDRGAANGRPRFSYDPAKRALIQLGGTGVNGGMDAWAFDAQGWRRLPEGPFAATQLGAFAYDPARTGFVYNTVDGGTFVLRDAGWSVIEPEGTSALAGAMAMSYDPSRRAMIALAPGEAWSLESGSSTWRMLPSAPVVSTFASIAFEARTGRMIANIGNGVFALADTTWSVTLSPGPFYEAVADPLRGTVVFVAAGAPIWELVDGVWFEAPNPAPGLGTNAVYSDIDGKLIIIAGLRAARLMFERRFVGISSRDACTGGDEDGDGLVDCADDDCWWSCTPACPPLASCP